jgi:nucleotide-binding universal stress UspA family protein
VKKILVPTDFSANSKSGVRFAIHWAMREKLELLFVHVLHILRPTHWSDPYYEKYTVQEKKVCIAKFEKFIRGIYNQMNVKPGKHSQIIIEGINADTTILDFCRNNPDVNYICISTHGVGKFKRIFGSNTGNLITKSPVPVLAVPKAYRIADIKTALYATDLRNYMEEIKKVVAFAVPLKTKIDVVHFTWPDEVSFDAKTIEAGLKQQFGYTLKLSFEKNDAVHTLIENLQKQVRIRKPSIVIMFTNQQRTLFEKLFLSSKAEEFSFQLKVPLLVFNKE